jgi:hypothetical protein
MKGKMLFGVAVLCLFASLANAQFRSNMVKVNLTAIPLKNYSLQYEGVLTRKISVALSFRTMPATTLPFKNEILKAVNSGDATTKKTIEDFELSNIAITPEVRFYLGKGNGRGFYIAPFYRYARYKTNTLPFDYEGAGTSGTINLSGTLTSNTGGLMFGSQWLIGRRVVLDWWIFGPQYGSAKGDFEGTSSKPLTQQEQDDLRQTLNDIDIPLTDKTVNVTANGASLKLSGPWAGIRSGISLGIRF